MSEKIRIFHFHNGGGGGVLSVIKNLLSYSKNAVIENHIIFTVNKDLIPVYEMPSVKGAVSQQVFYYSPGWNFYYTCRQLAKLLPDEKSVVIAHDWLELGMMSNLGLQNPVVQILHGNYGYYYELAKKHADSVDHFICVSPVIYKNLCELLPLRKNEIHYCRFPVPPVPCTENKNELLQLFYCVRDLESDNKQFKLLPKINAELQSWGLPVHWTIIGDRISSEEIKKQMNQQQDINIYHQLDNAEVLKLLAGHHIFLLPSLKEGFPVAVVEAMKAGLVPLVTDWEGATAELIVHGETGFYIEPGDAIGYSRIIKTLNSDRISLMRIAESGKRRANQMFDPVKNTIAMEDVFFKAAQPGTQEKNKKKVYGSRLDNPIIPNGVTKFIRRKKNTWDEAKN